MRPSTISPKIAHSPRDARLLAVCGTSGRTTATTMRSEPTWIRQSNGSRASPWLYVRRSAIRLRQQRLEQALADCNQAIGIAPNDVLAYLSRARVWETSGDLKRASDDLGEAVRSIRQTPWRGPSVPGSGCLRDRPTRR